MKKYDIDDLTAEVLMEMVQEVNSWDGSLYLYDYWVNDEEFFNTFYEGRPMEAVRAAYYGDYRDEDDYVRFNGVENLESASGYALGVRLINNVEEIAERYVELVDNGSIKDYAGVLMEDEEEE